MNNDEQAKPLAGYKYIPFNDNFEDLLGPFLINEESGEISCAVQTDERHSNSMGILHGGFLMTFADYALFAFSECGAEQPSVTVGFNSEFIASGNAGDMVIARGECLRKTKSMVFARGSLMVGDDILMTFSGVLKRLKPR